MTFVSLHRILVRPTTSAKRFWMELRSRFTTRTELRINMFFIFDRALSFPISLIKPGTRMLPKSINLLTVLGIILRCSVDLICDSNSGRGNVIREYRLLFGSSWKVFPEISEPGCLPRGEVFDQFVTCFPFCTLLSHDSVRAYMPPIASFGTAKSFIGRLSAKPVPARPLPMAYKPV